MLEVSLRGQIRNEDIRKRTKVLSGSEQGTFLEECMADGAENYWSGRRELEDAALERIRIRRQNTEINIVFPDNK